MAYGAASTNAKDINRSWLVRAGKYLRQFINPAIKKYSEVGTSPVLDNAYFPWIEELESNWISIRSEALRVLRYKKAIPLLSELSPDHRRLDSQKKWRSFFLWGYGYKSVENCKRCPKTTKIVSAIPSLRTALFSIHEPGMTIAPHKGVTSGICVLHLGLKIPKAREDCAIRVENQVQHWEDGKAFVFDDTYEHETWNNTDETRVILLLHFDRPVHFPGNLLAAIFMTCICISPFISDARKQMDKWETVYQKMERGGD